MSPDAPDAEVFRLPGYGRHARTAETGPPPVPTLPIRSAERRRWSAELSGPALGGLVVHGVGGIGKSVLAAQIAARLPRLDPDCAAVSLTGEITPDNFLAAVATAVRRHPLAVDRGGTVAEAAAAADRADLPWTQRMSLLREHVLARVPLLLVLDNFDDNLILEAGTCTIRDPELVRLLNFWLARPHRGRLLITCRHRFAVPDAAGSLQSITDPGHLKSHSGIRGPGCPGGLGGCAGCPDDPVDRGEQAAHPDRPPPTPSLASPVTAASHPPQAHQSPSLRPHQSAPPRKQVQFVSPEVHTES
ncbi:MAG TPA: AAA family ATPase [Streptosporangiaceae bacterium]|nr:AAA family ATPase [Streptosporangiaceae bacterium]